MRQPLVIAVTGAKGFVGSVFALRAVERGHRVLALDDESRGENPIESAIGGSYVKHDCARGFADALDGYAEGVDVVAHFAAATGSLERPLEELRALNVEMTQHVYQDALRFGARTFLWPTTSLAVAVPDSPYVISKEEALGKLRDVDRDHGIAVPLRFWNVLGAYKGMSELRKNEVHILPMMHRAATAGEPFVINGDDYETADGTPSRDFVHVLDVVEYLLDITELRATLAATGLAVGELAEHSLTAKPSLLDGAIWLGRGVPTTVRQMVALYEQFTDTTLAMRIGPRRAFDCGAIPTDMTQADQFARWRRGLTPTWVAVKDELAVLQRYTGWMQAKLYAETTIDAKQGVTTR